MQITTRVAKTGTLALVVAGLATAVVHGLPEPADVAVAPTVERDSADWTMPLDAYAMPAGSKSDYAENLLADPCLRKAGIDDPPPWATVSGLQADSDASDTDARGNPSPALATTRPLTAALAGTRGYHGPSTAGANRQGMTAWGFDADRNAAFAALPDGVAARCWNAARKTLGNTATGHVQEASAVAKRLTRLAALDARRDEAVVSAAERWRSCMEPSGVRDLPAAPDGMPTPSMGVGPTDVPVETGIGSVEIAVAKRDVACQTSSGYRKTLYDAEWNRLLHVTASDAAVLAAAEPDQLAVDARLDRTIERLAPKAPAGVD
ncbi:hypothetical protein AAEP80_07565 [Curtobacterium sp. L3-7]|uniref:hypothetical protein n=1 Tax=Curtobacterium sp. L3-7 TaxID=3138787 RepID=UPI003B516222